VESIKSERQGKFIDRGQLHLDGVIGWWLVASVELEFFQMQFRIGPHGRSEWGITIGSRSDATR